MSYRGMAPATRIELARSPVTGECPHQWTSQALGDERELNPLASVPQTDGSADRLSLLVTVRPEGFEPSFPAHQASVLPLN